MQARRNPASEPGSFCSREQCNRLPGDFRSSVERPALADGGSDHLFSKLLSAEAAAF